MTDFGQYGDKAKDLLSEHQDKVDEGTQQAGDFVDEKTGGQYSEQIDGVQEKAQDMMGQQGEGQQSEGQQGEGGQGEGQQGEGGWQGEDAQGGQESGGYSQEGGPEQR